jgi:hypothetical protein
MANNCTNYITVSGDPELMKYFYESYTTPAIHDFDFNLITQEPTKEEFNDMGIDWYYWRVEHWGNKWNAESYGYPDVEKDYYHIGFDTAWSPCEPISKKLIQLCPGLEIQHVYYEPGEGYAGEIFSIENGQYEQIDYFYSDNKLEYYYYIYDNERWECPDNLYDLFDEAYESSEISNRQYEELKSIWNQDNFNLRYLLEKMIEYNIL